MLVRGTGGLSPHKALALFVIARYFGYENDRTHVIKVVVLVVKITIQLTYGIHGFTKKKHTTTVVYLMAMPEPQESPGNKYLGHRMLFNSRKVLITKII